MNRRYIDFFQIAAVRASIVAFFVILIALFLYAPCMYDALFGQEDVLTVYVTRETLSIEMFEKFEKKTGIRVRVTYFDTNEEMLAKFKISRGVGYDVVVPSDYMVDLLIKEGLLQPLDHTKISNISQLDPRLLNKFYDPQSQYSLPLSWIPYGIAYNKEVITLPETVSWDIVYKKEELEKLGDYKISMLNDVRETIFLTAIYLFGSVQNLTEEKLHKVKDVLIAQKPIVECYTETGAKYLLLANVVPVVVLPAARLKEMGDISKYGFVIPKEGSLVEILTVGIPETSKKVDAAHKLIDFLLSKEVNAYNFEALDCNPSNRDSYALIDKAFSQNKAFFPDDKTFERLHMLHNQIPPALLEKIWFLVKSA